MSRVFVTTYEIINAGRELAAAHFAAEDAYREAAFETARKFGAVGFLPTKWGAPGILYFEGAEPPAGFKYARREDREHVGCTPRMNTAVGKAAKAALTALGSPPNDSDLLAKLGWSPNSYPTDGRKIYFGTVMYVTEPVTRYFARLPRQEGDGWEAPANLREIPESELMRAVEQHNAAAKALREAA